MLQYQHAMNLFSVWCNTDCSDNKQNNWLNFLLLYTVFRKKHPLTFYFISPWKMFRFSQKF